MKTVLRFVVVFVVAAALAPALAQLYRPLVSPGRPHLLGDCHRRGSPDGARSHGLPDSRLASRAPLHRRPADAQVPRDLTLRNTIRDQPPDQSPILHRDHPSNLSGWPRFRPSLWPRFQASSTRSNTPDSHKRHAVGGAVGQGDKDLQGQEALLDPRLRPHNAATSAYAQRAPSGGIGDAQRVRIGTPGGCLELA